MRRLGTPPAVSCPRLPPHSCAGRDAPISPSTVPGRVRAGYRWREPRVRPAGRPVPCVLGRDPHGQAGPLRPSLQRHHPRLCPPPGRHCALLRCAGPACLRGGTPSRPRPLPTRTRQARAPTGSATCRRKRTASCKSAPATRTPARSSATTPCSAGAATRRCECWSLAITHGAASFPLSLLPCLQGQCRAPQNHQFRQVSASLAQHACAVDPEGELRCWGANSAGQALPGFHVDAPGDDAEAPQFARVAAGSWATCGILVRAG